MWFRDLIFGQSVAQSMIIIGLVAASGLAIGAIRVWGISLGIAGVLFAGIAFGHFGLGISPSVLDFVREFGLILFVYTIGIQVGPGFFSSLRRQGLSLNILAGTTVLIGAAITILLGYLATGPDKFALAVGVFSGATTNTPSLAAAQQALADVSGISAEALKLPGLGYALAYPFGIVGIILAIVLTRLVFRIKVADEAADLDRQHRDSFSPVTSINIVVKNSNLAGRQLKEVPTLGDSGVVISRVMHADSRPEIARADTVISIGDVLLAVGPKEKLQQLILIIGEKSEINLQKVDSDVISRDVLVTDSSALRQTIGELDFRQRFGVAATRIRRAEVQLPTRSDLKLQFGDTVKLVGTEADIQAASRELGDSKVQLNYPRLIPVFIGIVLGVVLGSIPIAVPGMPSPIRLGLAGGPLIAAIILSRIGSIGPLVWYMRSSAIFMMREMGIVLFLSCVGIKAGDHFVSVLMEGQGLYWLGCGALITIVPLLIVALIARLFYKLNFLYLCGLLAGSMTDPPALAFATSLTGSQEPSISYSTVYPLTMLLRVVCAQVMVILFCH
jgi:putative transport protein